MIASIDLDGENIHQIPKFTTIYSIKTVHQSHDAFIERVSGNKDAIAVKIIDLEGNLNITRLANVTEKDCKRLDKYIQVWKKLKEL
jgi:acetolactate synthase small subunit